MSLPVPVNMLQNIIKIPVPVLENINAVTGTGKYFTEYYQNTGTGT